MDDPRSLELALREIHTLVVPADDDDKGASEKFVAAHLQAGTSKEVSVQLGRLFLLSRSNEFPWKFFKPLDSLYGLKVTTPNFAITVPESLRDETARVLWNVRQKVRQFYSYPLWSLPLIATVFGALAYLASPVVVTVAVAVTAATLAAIALLGQRVNQQIKELDEVSSTLKPALLSGGTS